MSSLRMNAEMARIYNRPDTLENIQSAVLPDSLVKILDTGFTEYEGAVLLGKWGPSEVTHRYHDLIDMESSINHIHMEDHTRDGIQNIERLWIGIKYARELEERLTRAYPGEPFEISVSTDWESFGGCVVRFVKPRDGEGWLTRDLEGYLENGILVIDT